MNFLRHTLLLIILGLSLSSSAQTAKEAAAHLEDITASLEQFRQDTWDLLKNTVNGQSSEEVDWAIKTLTDKIEAERSRVAAKDGFYGDLTAKVAMNVFLKNSHRILSDDFRNIKKLEQKSQESFEDMEDYLQAQNVANERLDEAGRRFDDEIIRFAKRYNVEVTNIKGEMATKLEKASQALGYYNQVYLSYFKVYHQKLALYRALKSQDTELISEEIAKFKTYIELGSNRLMILGGFLEDEALSQAAINILNQYKYESEVVFPAALKTIERQQLFNMAQNLYNQIPDEEITENDVAHLNSLIDPLNSAVERQNEEFSKAERQKQILFGEWNMQIKIFFAKYLS